MQSAVETGLASSPMTKQLGVRTVKLLALLRRGKPRLYR
jgi:hypothetical protein